MAIVRPFYGVRFTEKAGKIGDICCPPYNLISEDDKKVYSKKNSHNIIRLEKPGDKSADFKKAKKTFDKWLEEGVLEADEEAGLYIYEQSYEAEGVERSFRGFIGRVFIYDYERGIILPHKETDPETNEDRYCLIKSLSANVSPICAAYEDEKGVIEKSIGKLIDREPEITFTDESGVTHKFWVCPRSTEVDRISANMAGKKLYITEGQHRYEAALRYRNHLVQKGIIDEMGENEADYVMTMLINSESCEAQPSAVHRVVHSLPKFSTGKFTTAAGEFFEISTTKSQETACLKLKNMNENGDCTVALYDGKKYTLLQLKKSVDLKAFIPEKRVASRTIAVNVLHKIIFENIMGMDLKGQKTHLGYTSSVQEAAKAVDSGEGNCCFLLEPLKISDIIEISGEKLPENATCFNRVPCAGFVMNRINNEPKVKEKVKQDYVSPEADFLEI